LPVYLSDADKRNDTYGSSEATNIFVPDNYTTIQAAVDAANESDIILVRTGLYEEHIEVNKSISILGLDFPTISTHSPVTGFGFPTVSILADNVALSGFILEHGGTRPLKENDQGIDLEAANCNIIGNVIRHNLDGIMLSSGCCDNILANNTIEDNHGFGIGCAGSDNLMANNTISRNYAIGVLSSGSNSLLNNTIEENWYGIALWFKNNILRNNNMTNNVFNFQFDGAIGGPEMYYQDIDTSNTVNGKPMYYFINESNKKVPTDAGYVALINCTNFNVANLDLERNAHGVQLAFSMNCTITDCNFSNNEFGLFIYESTNNTIYNNNFVNNTFQVGNMYSWYGSVTLPSNTWNKTYPNSGNFWSNCSLSDSFRGVYQNETDSDGVADAPYIIDVNNQDNFPLMAPITSFDAGTWNSTPCAIHVVTNSTVSDFDLNGTEKVIKLNVTGESGLGFCRVTIPNVIVQNMWQDNYMVFVDNQPPLEIRNWTDPENTYIYFTYQHSQHEIAILPEFPAVVILIPILATAVMGTALLRRKADKRTATHDNGKHCIYALYKQFV
jgi:parallel beta-helix repeat protein